MDPRVSSQRPSCSDGSRGSTTFLSSLTKDQNEIFCHICRLFQVELESSPKRQLPASDSSDASKSLCVGQPPFLCCVSRTNTVTDTKSEHAVKIATIDTSNSEHNTDAKTVSTCGCTSDFLQPLHDDSATTTSSRSVLNKPRSSLRLAQCRHEVRGHHYLIVSGPAGTGKSHLVKELFNRVLDRYAINPKLLTPTNCAATFIDGVTIDKFLCQFLSTSSVALYERLELLIIEKKLGLQRFKTWSQLVTCVRDMIKIDQRLLQMPSCGTNFVAIDEMSMVSLLKLAMVAALMPSDCIFLLLGDACQLPPVVNLERIKFACQQKNIKLSDAWYPSPDTDTNPGFDGYHQPLHSGSLENRLITGNVFCVESEPLFEGFNNVRFHMTQNVRFSGDLQGFLSAHGATIRHCLLHDLSLVEFNALHADKLFFKRLCEHATTHSSKEFDLLLQPKVVLSATIRNVLKHEKELMQEYVTRNHQAINIVYAMFSFEFRDGTCREFRPKDLLNMPEVREAFRKHLRQDSALHVSLGIPVVFTMTSTPDNGLPEGVYNGLVGTFEGISFRELHPTTGDALMVRCDKQLIAVPLVLANLTLQKEGYKFKQLVDTLLSKWPVRPADDGLLKHQIVGFTVKHFPLLPLLASTVHGVQGSTLTIPVLVDGRRMSKQHYYVATTRSTRANNLYFDKLFTEGKRGRRVQISNAQSVARVWNQCGPNYISKLGYHTSNLDIKNALERCQRSDETVTPEAAQHSVFIGTECTRQNK